MQEDPGAGDVAGAGGPEKAPAGMFATAFTAPQLRTREHRPGEPEPRKWRGAGTAPGFPVEEPHAATRARTAARSRAPAGGSSCGSWLHVGHQGTGSRNRPGLASPVAALPALGTVTSAE